MPLAMLPSSRLVVVEVLEQYREENKNYSELDIQNIQSWKSAQFTFHQFSATSLTKDQSLVSVCGVIEQPAKPNDKLRVGRKPEVNIH